MYENDGRFMCDACGEFQCVIVSYDKISDTEEIYFTYCYACGWQDVIVEDFSLDEDEI